MGAIFEEPQDFRPEPPKGTLATYSTLTTNTDLQINLIGSSPLYGHILTHACLFLAKHLEMNAAELVKGKTVLEVGAGGGLPSVLCAHLGAAYVMCTDYPDPELVSNLRRNVQENGVESNCTSAGFIWGNDTGEIVDTLSAHTEPKRTTFDVIILSDVIFNHKEHPQLLKTCRDLVTPKTGKILVTFTPHRPKLFEEDMRFFDTARDFGFVPSFVEMEHWSPLFKNDHDESTRELRSRVYFYVLTP